MKNLRTNFNKVVVALVEFMELEAREESSLERVTMLEEKYEELIWTISRVNPGSFHKIEQVIIDTAECIINSEEVDINLDWGYDRLTKVEIFSL